MLNPGENEVADDDWRAVEGQASLYLEKGILRVSSSPLKPEPAPEPAEPASSEPEAEPAEAEKPKRRRRKKKGS